MVNRYYAGPPGKDYSKGMEGLGNIMTQISDRKAGEEAKVAEEDRITGIKQAGLEAYQSGDPEKVREFIISNPEMAGPIKQAFDLKFPGNSGKAYKNAMFRAAIDFSQAPKYLEEMEIQFSEDGVIDEQERIKLDNLKSAIETDPEEAQRIIKTDLYTLSDKDTLDRYDSFNKEQKIDPDDKKTYAPSPLKKLINERQKYIEEGLLDTDPIIKAYDSKISGTDIDIKDMTDDEVDTWGSYVALTGKLPSVGRGKQATKIRVAILKSAARQHLGADSDGIPDEPNKTPAEAALSILGEQSDTKAIQGSLNFLDKQLSSMGSFVTNLNSQVDKVNDLSKDLKTFDTRLLNIPLRSLRGRIKGSPLQAKYDMYLSEIESEIGKLATGSTGSVAELSATAQEKWSKIHDKNLSVSDMLSLLEETKSAANFRLDSVQGQLNKTRSRMRREGTLPEEIEQPRTEAPQSSINFLINNPQHAEAFKVKYGYLPGEMKTEGL